MAAILVTLWPVLAAVEGLISLQLSMSPQLMLGRVLGTVVIFSIPAVAAMIGVLTIRRAPRIYSILLIVAAAIEFLGLLALILLPTYRCWTPLCGD
ncbi:MAG: hypothetical protein ACR2MY_06985 [Candidatus Dormibacteria bacterium]